VIIGPLSYQNPVDPFGMADLGFAQTPRGLGDTEPALIKRSPYHSAEEVVSAVAFSAPSPSGPS